ncbi:MAG: membrane protein insertion efficiency factor YidD [Chloroflexi bacterium]|nr:membrane protein insertion efficiency factor YidD [Chloroflexota bacterium]MQC48229.1 membrane protein insertion efficiency factor YidD [Chloroflexota bacterium]
MRTLLLTLIRGYQRGISPMLGVACRYEPSCSRYSYESIATHGVWRGLLLTLRRLGSCRPGGGSGYDPVPYTFLRHSAPDDASGRSSHVKVH